MLQRAGSETAPLTRSVIHRLPNSSTLSVHWRITTCIQERLPRQVLPREGRASVFLRERLALHCLTFRLASFL